MKIIGEKSFVIIGKKLLKDRLFEADTFSDEDDILSSAMATPDGEPIKLFDHLQGVSLFASRFAKGCDLDDSLINALEKSAMLHDLGKADPRFQSLLRGGNRWAVTGELLAKSDNISTVTKFWNDFSIYGDYPKNGRHELLSIRLAEQDVDLSKDVKLKDLILHLIGSHHGYCRPFAPVINDEQPPEVRLDFLGTEYHFQGRHNLEKLDSGVSERFWDLTRRYGWWGLAWLETILRLADHRCSEFESRGGVK